MNPVVNHFLKPAIVSLVLLTGSASALPDDKYETIRGRANNLTIDNKTGVATYTGNVNIQQGSLNIVAENLKIHRNAEGDIEKMIALGNPARFQQQPEAEKGIITASAKSITYLPATEHLVLEENASVEQDGSIMSGATIDYDLIKEIMKASGNIEQTGSSGVEILIPAKKKNPETR
ncbi:MAG: lipopolysaccharide transport periplasmic protein LptA [Cellvibrio sp.]|nr:lipopolysaccharide transport periplasmic protein LptA [Cellvibrio sp.]